MAIMDLFFPPKPVVKPAGDKEPKQSLPPVRK